MEPKMSTVYVVTHRPGRLEWTCIVALLTLNLVSAYQASCLSIQLYHSDYVSIVLCCVKENENSERHTSLKDIARDAVAALRHHIYVEIFVVD